MIKEVIVRIFEVRLHQEYISQNNEGGSQSPNEGICYLRRPEVTCLTSKCRSAGPLCCPFTDRSDILSARHPPMGH